jgi:hypothetical protein
MCMCDRMCLHADRASNPLATSAHAYARPRFLIKALGNRLKTLQKTLEELQGKYVIGRHASAVSTGGSLYQRLDGPGL